MTITTVKIALFVIAAVLIGYGIRSDSSVLRIIGIAVLVVAFLLRFLPKESK